MLEKKVKKNEIKGQREEPEERWKKIAAAVIVIVVAS